MHTLSNKNQITSIAKSFSKAANLYNEHAIVQKIIAERLVEDLDFIDIEPKNILDLGCGTGFITEILVKKFPTANITCLDIADGMVKYIKNKYKDNSKINYIVANAELLPIQPNAFDLIISNCSLHWFLNLNQCLNSILASLKDNGVFLCSSLDKNTLYELRQTWSSIDKYQHINSFYSIQMLGDLLLKLGFNYPVLNKENITLQYSNVATLLKDLKNIGSINISNNKQVGLFSKNKLNLLDKIYRDKFLDSTGKLPATYEVTYAMAWKNRKTPNKTSTESISNIKVIS